MSVAEEIPGAGRPIPNSLDRSIDVRTGTIMPGATKEEGQAIGTALNLARSYGFDGAGVHLTKAATDLKDGDFADGVAESIHAVESVARSVPGNDKATLGKILNAIDDTSGIHGSLKEGFIKIYGYTSDENGIRHSLLGDKSKVDQHDAVFMLGACASFVTYLINKGRAAGIFAEE